MSRFRNLSHTLAVSAAFLAVSVHCRADEPFFKGLGPYSRHITTAAPLAEKYFNQGLAFLHGFNHGAAVRSFREAERIDPKCAMAHWAIALSSGPHINFPAVPPAAAELAWKELTLARECAAGASPVEKALIDALSTRYANPQPDDRSGLDLAYANAMRKVWAAFPKDPDVGAFFAESMLDIRPWDQWTLDGKPQPGTDEILDTLRKVINLSPKHPFANHLYIHSVEASPHPELADKAANLLRTLQPAIAHNVHMPSHIDIHRGRWRESIAANLKAVEADRQYRAVVGPATGLLPMYIAHNEHMLAYSAMMIGRSKLAIDHIRAMNAGMPEAFVKEYAPMIESYLAMPLEVLIRFGKWDDILAEPDNTREYMPFCKAFRHAARAIAHAAKGDSASAREEQALFLAAAAMVPKEEGAGNNSAADILALVTHMVEGEISVRDGSLDKGLTELRTAVTLEDALKYDEPPGWLIPLRHTLGASLMNGGKFAEAETVYREQIRRLPGDGWALYGLAQSLHSQGKHADAIAADREFKKAWAGSDIKITSSCLCLPGK